MSWLHLLSLVYGLYTCNILIDNYSLGSLNEYLNFFFAKELLIFAVLAVVRGLTKQYIEEQEIYNRIGKQYLLPARASEQGNVIGLVSVYIYPKKICN